MLDDLKKKAQKATPGPWYFDCGNGDVESHHPDFERTEICERSDLGPKMDWHKEHNMPGELPVHPDVEMEYIAAASPDVVLRLIAVAEAGHVLASNILENDNPDGIEDFVANLKELERGSE